MPESTIVIDPRLHAIAARQPYPLLFATVSGAHLYGFPSPDSDYDLRGVHILPLPRVVGLDPGPETIEVSEVVDGIELDLVTHDAHKFFTLLLKRNGYVLEQLTSPLVVQTTPEYEELCALAPQLVTRHHSHHYLGFAVTQWRLFEKEQPRRAKPLLYVYRVLLTGIHLMQTGEIEANLVRLNERFRLPYLPELIARKLDGPEHGTLDDIDMAFYRGEYERLRAALEEAQHASQLPDAPSGRAALDDLLIRVRQANSKRMQHG
jgi:predicted nucleotidyltransferase